MTRDEYIQLAKNAASFKSLPREIQEMVLNATDAQREKYAQMYLSERDQLAQAQKDFLQANTNAVTSFKTSIKTEKKGLLVREEGHAREQDEITQENLLKQIS